MTLVELPAVEWKRRRGFRRRAQCLGRTYEILYTQTPRPTTIFMAVVMMVVPNGTDSGGVAIGSIEASNPMETVAVASRIIAAHRLYLLATTGTRFPKAAA